MFQLYRTCVVLLSDEFYGSDSGHCKPWFLKQTLQEY